MKLSLAFYMLPLLCAGLWASAQAQQATTGALGYYNDALRFSQTRFGGTARFQGLAGANTAIGGDLTSAFINPAGLGFLRRSEAALSLSMLNSGNNATYLSNNTSGTGSNLGVGHLGVAFGSDLGGDRAVRGSTFAITFTRNNDFREEINIEGLNNQTSFIDLLLERADGRVKWDDMLDESRRGIFTVEGMGFATYLIKPFLGDNTTFDSYDSFVPESAVVPMLQSERISRTGTQNVWNFAYGLNLLDKIYLGASVNVATMRYQQTREYGETSVPPTGIPTPLNNFLLRETNNQDASGFSATLGIIARPVDALRIGASITTPTSYRVNDFYQGNINVLYNNIRYTDPFTNPPRNLVLNQVRANTIPLQSRYTMRLPMRVNLGAALFLGKRGFISADAELVDYTTARFSNPDPVFSFDADNSSIKALYRSAMNIRAGAEFRIKDFRVRGGYALMQSPMRNSGDDRSRSFITGGAGIRKGGYYVDLAVIYSAFDVRYRPYELFYRGPTPTANIDASRLGLTLTGGFFF